MIKKKPPAAYTVIFKFYGQRRVVKRHTSHPSCIAYDDAYGCEAFDDIKIINNKKNPRFAKKEISDLVAMITRELEDKEVIFTADPDVEGNVLNLNGCTERMGRWCE